MIEHILSFLLRGVHAGEARLAWNDPAFADVPASIKLESPAFVAGTAIPRRFAGKGVGDNVSPPLSWSNMPKGAAELVLIVEDPDAPLRRPFVHLIATGIDPRTGGLPEAALSGTSLPPGVALGRNTFRRVAYAGPRALPNHGPHRYVFQLFALGKRLSLAGPPSLAELKAAMAGAVLARARLDGIYERRG